MSLHGARILEWDEDPIEELPAGVSRQVNNVSFEAPNRLEFESLNLRLVIEIRHVSITIGRE